MDTWGSFFFFSFFFVCLFLGDWFSLVDVWAVTISAGMNIPVQVLVKKASHFSGYIPRGELLGQRLGV